MKTVYVPVTPLGVQCVWLAADTKEQAWKNLFKSTTHLPIKDKKGFQQHGYTVRAWKKMKPTIELPSLNPGERYAGCLGDTAGNLHHVILLPGDNNDATLQHQKEWAASIGGELPTRLEQALLWQNCREHFKQDLYWSGEAFASDAGLAWFQNVNFGYQDYGTQHGQLRARAVRRVLVEMKGGE